MASESAENCTGFWGASVLEQHAQGMTSMMDSNRTCWRLLCALVTLCALSACGSSNDRCTSDDSYEGPRGVVYCFFEDDIVIEGGFSCPASMPVFTELPRGAVCSSEPLPDAGELPGALCRRGGLMDCATTPGDASIFDAMPPVVDAGADGAAGFVSYEDLAAAQADGLVTYIPLSGTEVIDYSAPGGVAAYSAPGSYDPGPEIADLGPVYNLQPATGFFLPTDPTAGSQRFTVMFVLAPGARHPGTGDRILDVNKQERAGCGDQLQFSLEFLAASSEYRSFANVACGEVVELTRPRVEAELGSGAVTVFYSFDGGDLRTWLGGSSSLVSTAGIGGRNTDSFYIGASCNGGVCDGRGPGAALLSVAMWSRVLDDDEMVSIAATGAELIPPAGLPAFP